MTELIKNPLFGLTATLFVFQLAKWLQQKTKQRLLHPMLISTLLLIGLLSIANIDYVDYNRGGQYITFLLGPATVALAIPLVRQLPVLRKNWQAILIGVVSGSLIGVVSVLGIASFLDASLEITLSLTPKSVTTPIAMEIARSLGGIPSLTVGAVIIAGLTGAIIGPALLTRIGVKNQIARGLAIGAASHALGADRCLEDNELAGAVSGVAIALVGVVTALMASPLSSWLLH
ncbi:Inner membrane protein YohK [Sporomusa silvacetica DSM 10669]|uniref:Inner membrane protein YohK n=1 Tax=Sporomusa silvacetica DSM 10669 TaxID=1123289 RepID=A0ABZ3IVJ2_9FIRM|nr:LrgB family protein [Sporomusa silvacetica]OZC12994.1 inner membrane protein YohK [Sporomusa silvacetica DSM 10669]